MAFVEDPILGDISDPLNLALAQNTATLQRKWDQLAPLMSGFPQPIPAAIRALDEQRVQRGAQPYPKDVTIRAATAAAQNALVTKQPERSLLNVPGNVLRDLRNIVGGIPRMPLQMVHEITDLPNIATRIAEGKGNIVQRVAAAPGVRLLPGSFTVGQLAAGPEGLRELATHPLMAALDVLPAASKIAEATPVAKAVAARAGDTAAEQARLLGRSEAEIAAAAERAVEKSNGLRATLFNRLRDGEIQRNPAGTLVDALGDTRAGTVARSTFGRLAREDAREANLATQALRHGLNTDGPIPSRFAGMEDIVEVGRASRKLRDEFAESQSPEWIADTNAKMQLGDYGAMSPEQVAYTQRYRELRQPIEDWKIAQQELATIDGEVYTWGEARPLLHKRRTARRVGELADIADAMHGEALTLDDYLARAKEVAARPTAAPPQPRGSKRTAQAVAAEEETGALTLAHKRKLIEGWVTAAQVAGYDTTPILKTLRTLKGSNIDDAARVLDGFAADARTVTSPDQMLATLEPWAKRGTWPKVNVLYDDIKAGRWAAARRHVRELSRNTRASIPDAAAWMDDLRALERRDKWVQKSLPVSARRDWRAAATKAEEAAATAVAAAPPTRFGPAIAERVKDRLVSTLDAPEARDRVLNAYLHNRLDQVGIDPAEVAKWTKEVSATWQEMRDAGLDPVFVHRVHPGRAHELVSPKLGIVPKTPSQVKERALDASPAIKDPFVALTHEAYEWMNRRVSEDFISTIRALRGRTRAQVFDEMLPEAQRIALDPIMGDERAVLDELVARRYTAFNPDKHGYSWASPKLRALHDEEWFLPKYLADNLERLHNPRVDTIGAVFDPVMRVFRTSVIPLRPQTQINNVLGGGILAAVQHGPEVFGKWAQARRMLAEGTLPEELRLTMGDARNAFADMNYAGGRTLARLWDETQAAKAAKRVGDGLNKVTDKMFDLNEFFDNQYRAMSYLQGEDVARRAGKSAEYAHAAGLEAARNVLQQWADLTPLERGIIRSVVPFYSFASFSIRNALRLAAEHPTRVAMIDAFARAELADLGDALPERFLGIFFFGGTDAAGNRRAFNFGAANPFASLPDTFTSLGFLSSLNPVLATLAEQAGIRNGQREAYPTLRYNPETGRLEATHPGLLSSFVQNVIPQTQALSVLAGMNSDFRRRAATDPEGAWRGFWSSVGVPVVGSYRTYNVPQEIAKHEIVVGDEARKALRDAVASGDDSYASRFATNEPKLGEIRQIQQAAPTDMLAQIQQILDSKPTASASGRISIGGV